MKAGRALRDGWAMEAAAAKVCHCGHTLGEHRLLPRETYEIVEVDGAPQVITTQNPAYQPTDFHCSHEGCSCVHRVLPR